MASFANLSRFYRNDFCWCIAWACTWNADRIVQRYFKWSDYRYFSLYYSPIQILTGLLAGLILPRYLGKDKNSLKLLLLALILSVPGTIVSSIITVQLFGGITSSGSSMIVQLLHGLGLSQTTSVILVQAGTDYLDRLLSIVVVSLVITMLPQRLIYSKKNRLNKQSWISKIMLIWLCFFIY